MSESGYTSYTVNADVGKNYLDDVIRWAVPYSPEYGDTCSQGEYSFQDALNSEDSNIEAVLQLAGIAYDHFKGSLGDGSEQNVYVNADGEAVHSVSADRAQFTAKELVAVGRSAAGYDMSDHDYQIAKSVMKIRFSEGDDYQRRAMDFFDELTAIENAITDIEATIKNTYVSVEQALANVWMNKDDKQGELSNDQVERIVNTLYEKSDLTAIVTLNGDDMPFSDVIKQYADSSHSPR